MKSTTVRRFVSLSAFLALAHTTALGVRPGSDATPVSLSGELAEVAPVEDRIQGRGGWLEKLACGGCMGAAAVTSTVSGGAAVLLFVGCAVYCHDAFQDDQD